MLSAYLRPFLYCLRSYSFYTTRPIPSTTNGSQLSLIRWSLALSRLELGATRTMICLRTASFDSASCCCAFLPVLLISLAIYLSLARNPHAHTTAVPTTKTPRESVSVSIDRCCCCDAAKTQKRRNPTHKRHFWGTLSGSRAPDMTLIPGHSRRLIPRPRERARNPESGCE